MKDNRSASDRLREFVRDRVKPGSGHYERGTAAELAKFLRGAGFSEDAAWISAYADPDAKPRRNADIDVAFAICAFFGVDLGQFQAGGPGLSRHGSTVGSSKGGSDVPASVQRAHLREVTTLKARIARQEAALSQVRDVARRLAKIAARKGRSVAVAGA